MRLGSNICLGIIYEIKLLQLNKPHMLCIDDMVMPNVIKYCNAVRLPWPCDKRKSKFFYNRVKKYKIALIIGKTQALISWFKFVISPILDLVDAQLMISKHLIKHVPEKNKHKINSQ